MKQSLFPLSKFLLAVSAIVQFVFALPMLFAPSLVRSVLWPPPLDPPPDLALAFTGVSYVAMSLGAAYGLLQDDWAVGRTYLLIAGIYVALCVVLALGTAAIGKAAPVLWLYVVLAIIYVPLVLFAWRQQSARAGTA